MKKRLFLIIFALFMFNAFIIVDSFARHHSKKILMVIANQGFRDEEFKIPFDALKKEGYDVVIASSMLSTAQGMLGMKVEPDVLLVAVKPDDYSAVIFIGGTGARAFWDDVSAQYLAKRMYDEGKLVAAICIAPVILANAGILEGKKATVWQSESHRLQFKGANYTGKSVQVDGNIITADGPSSSGEFAKVVIEKMAEQDILQKK